MVCSIEFPEDSMYLSQLGELNSGGLPGLTTECGTCPICRPKSRRGWIFSALVPFTKFNDFRLGSLG